METYSILTFLGGMFAGAGIGMLIAVLVLVVWSKRSDS